MDAVSLLRWPWRELSRQDLPDLFFRSHLVLGSRPRASRAREAPWRMRRSLARDAPTLCWSRSMGCVVLHALSARPKPAGSTEGRKGRSEGETQAPISVLHLATSKR